MSEERDSGLIVATVRVRSATGRGLAEMTFLCDNLTSPETAAELWEAFERFQVAVRRILTAPRVELS